MNTTKNIENTENIENIENNNNNDTCKHYKWSFGETYEQSKRKNNNKNNGNVETTAYLAALNHDEHSWETLNSNQAEFSNKREEIEHKLSERDILPRTSMNPFMQSNNFSEDIDTFLKPQGTKLTNEK
jgi:hypothetical protein